MAPAGTSRITSSKVSKAAKAKRETPESKQRTKELRTRPLRPTFIPGSLNDQLSKLDIGESHAKCLRIPLAASHEEFVTINEESQKFFKAQNSILSGGIAKVRGSSDHKHKRFKMERGTYMSAGHDAMFAFLTVTRTE